MTVLSTDGAEYVTLSNKYRVWTRRFTSEVEGPSKGTILFLHGGPGFDSGCYGPFVEHLPALGFDLILYNQLGSHLSDQPDDESLWVLERFVEEVEEVRQGLELGKIILVGQSWGALLAMEYAVKYGQHLDRLILCNMVQSMEQYTSYLSELRAAMPEAVQAKMAEYEARNEMNAPEYESLMMEYLYKKHINRLPQWPSEVLRAFETANMVIYNHMQGPNEFVITGNLKDWDFRPKLANVKTSTLVICGEYDTMAPVHIRNMAQTMPNATAVVIPNGSHMSFYDAPEAFFAAIRDFLCH